MKNSRISAGAESGFFFPPSSDLTFTPCLHRPNFLQLQHQFFSFNLNVLSIRQRQLFKGASREINFISKWLKPMNTLDKLLFFIKSLH